MGRAGPRADPAGRRRDRRRGARRGQRARRAGRRPRPPGRVGARLGSLAGRPLTPVIVWQDKRQQELLARRDAAASVGALGAAARPLLLGGQARVAARQRPRRGAARERRHAAPGHRRRVSVRAPRRRASRPTCRPPRARSCSPSAGATGTSSCWHVFGVRARVAARARAELRRARRAAPRALARAAAAVRAARRPAGRARRVRRSRPGELKATYGTGVFVLGRTAECSPGASGLLPTVAWARPAADGTIGEISYALDGGVFAAGSLLDWLAARARPRGGRPALAALAATVPDSAGVRVLPALAGLGAPWWRPAARGVIAGLHPGGRAPRTSRARRSRRSPGASPTSSRRSPSVAPVDAAARRRRTHQRPDARADSRPTRSACRSAWARPTRPCSARRCSRASARVSSRTSRTPPRGCRRAHRQAPRRSICDARTQRARWRAFVQASSGCSPKRAGEALRTPRRSGASRAVP